MIEDVEELVLDGNAAAGLLQEIFVPDITIAQIECETCGTVADVGSLRLYAVPMGAILRCRHCDSILMRAVSTPHGCWIEMVGTRSLKFKPDNATGNFTKVGSVYSSQDCT